MPRKRTTKDFAIPMDEFHPKPNIAAAFADRKANDAVQEHLRADLKRVELRIENAGEDRMFALRGEQAIILGRIKQAEEDRKRIDEIIAEARVA